MDFLTMSISSSGSWTSVERIMSGTRHPIRFVIEAFFLSLPRYMMRHPSGWKRERGAAPIFSDIMPQLLLSAKGSPVRLSVPLWVMMTRLRWITIHLQTSHISANVP